MAPHIVPLAEAKTDKNGNYHVEASLAAPTHGSGPMRGYSRIYVDLAHQCGRYDLPPFAYADAQADVPTEYWNVQGGGKKVFDHDFLVNDIQD
ncbi:hypothetical protein AAVH_35662 [Aphelenchoides avenae]|nr:hypothetical protein AAVH_35662 [Aphelenchus avenae]